MDGKPPEFYIGLAAAMGFAYARIPKQSHLSRALYAGISGGLGYAAAPEIAKATGQSEVLTVIVITALGYILLDLGAELLSNTPWVRSIIKSRLGGGNDGKEI